jgi:hypothetical protein
MKVIHIELRKGKDTIKKFKDTISKRINPEQIKYIAMDIKPGLSG